MLCGLPELFEDVYTVYTSSFALVAEAFSYD